MGVGEAADQTGSIVGNLDFPKRVTNLRVAVEKYTGSISGQVVLPPPRVAGVWLSRDGLTAASSGASSVELTQKGYQFGQSMLVVPVGTTVAFPNEDPDYHNVFSLSRTKRFDLGRYKTGVRPTPSQIFDRPGLVILRCEIHEHMLSQILVVDSPYFTTTTPSGSFKLGGVAPGNYTLHALLDKKTTWTAQVSVKAGRVTNTQPILGTNG